jgi:hypothetical protein
MRQRSEGGAVTATTGSGGSFSFSTALKVLSAMAV